MSDPTSPSPSLMVKVPPEIWLRVFELTMTVPGELNRNACTIFERPGNPEVAIARADLVPTNLALLRTCRTFYSLAIEFLYRAILLRRQNAIERLLDTLQKSHAKVPVPGYTPKLGFRTRRLDVRIKAASQWKRKGETVVKLLPFFPNLVYLLGCGNWGQITSNLLIQPLSTLKHLQLLFVPIFEPETSYLELSRLIVSTLPNLGAIVFSLNRRSKLEPMLPNSFDNLRMMGTADSGLYHDSCQQPKALPSLRALHICSQEKINLDETFLLAHGAKITTIDMEWCPLDQLVLTAPWFPNLRQIIIDLSYSTFPKLKGLSGDIRGIESVKEVGLTIISRQLPISMYNTAFPILRKVFPQMVSLRFLEKRVVDLLMKQSLHKVKRWHEVMGEHKIHVEREDGECILAELHVPCSIDSNGVRDLTQAMRDLRVSHV
ncbi:hypothetical protein FRC17_005411 [Serendipita sp. 399]|nr:hypothetical protein FRC17_005411 [Serendipita sp. 399]